MELLKTNLSPKGSSKEYTKILTGKCEKSQFTGNETQKMLMIIRSQRHVS